MLRLPSSYHSLRLRHFTQALSSLVSDAPHPIESCGQAKVYSTSSDDEAPGFIHVSPIGTPEKVPHHRKTIPRLDLNKPPSLEDRIMYVKHDIPKDDPLVQRLFQGLVDGKRASLAESITLAESLHPRKRAQAQVLLEEVLERQRMQSKHRLHKFSSFRIGSISYSFCMLCSPFP